jgi:ABC-2 type transport system ATP-binding protein
MSDVQPPIQPPNQPVQPLMQPAPIQPTPIQPVPPVQHVPTYPAPGSFDPAAANHSPSADAAATFQAMVVAQEIAPGTPQYIPNPNNVVEIRALTKTYGVVRAVDGLNLDVARGSILGLIGPNGAGKTTTMAVMATLLLPTSGYVRVLGLDPLEDPIGVRSKVGYMPDIVGVYDRLQVDEYLNFFAHATGIPRKERPDLVTGLLELVDLPDKRKEMVDSLSRGMKQRLSLARALLHDPELLILDEPASGLDPRARVDLRLLLQELQSMGKTIIVSSHILAELQEMCTSVAVVSRGQVVAAGNIEDIARQMGGTRRILVTYADKTEETIVVADVNEQEQLLRRLVSDEHRRVVQFKEVGTDLEDLFMQLTASPAPMEQARV